MFDRTDGAARFAGAACDSPRSSSLEELDLGAGELVERGEILVGGDAGVGDDQDPVLDVIEGQHRVEQHEPRFVLFRRRAAVVPPRLLPGVGQRRLEADRGVVADEADGAAGEARQPGHERRAELRHHPPQHRNERLAGLGRHAGPVDHRAPAARPQHEERVLAEERIARDLLAAFHALEQERVVGMLGDLQEGRDRRQQIRHDLLDDRHERAAPRQLHEFFVTCLFHVRLLMAEAAAKKESKHDKKEKHKHHHDKKEKEKEKATA